MTLKKYPAGRLFFSLILLQLFCVQSLQAVQDEDRINISDVQRTIQKNWIGLPKSVNCTLYWEVYEKADDQWNPVDVNSFDYYQVIYRRGDDVSMEVKSGQVSGNFHSYPELQIGKRYQFIVEGYRDGIQRVVSDTASVVTTGKFRSNGPASSLKWHHYIPFNGRFPMSIVGKGFVFDVATKPGKIAFHLIWNFFIIGLVIMMFCFRYLRLSVVFPLQKQIRIGKGFDDIYDQGISKEFKDIVDEWRILVEETSEHIRDGLGKGDQVQLEEIENENVRFWHRKGAETIRKLSARLKKLHRYPTARIVQAGLKKNELGGFRWREVSKEVDRAIENRASSELDHLRRKSHMDWLWNLGTLAPMVGLFGTATGISFAFVTLTMLQRNITQTEVVFRLANGIFEALWTTIEGLFVGIVLMLLYYYYQNKLNWIYSKWEEIYVQISEKM